MSDYTIGALIDAIRRAQSRLSPAALKLREREQDFERLLLEAAIARLRRLEEFEARARQLTRAQPLD